MALTKEQIRREINNLTRVKNNYDSEVVKYRNSLSYANKLVKNLTNTINYLNSANDYMKRYFTINKKTADDGEINKNKEQINKIIKKLNSTIIPSINSNINDLNIKITKTNREINILKRQYETVEI